MDFNPFLNKLITERNSAVVEDPLVDLLAEMVKAIVRLEAQQETPASAEQPVLTEPRMKVDPSVAASPRWLRSLEMVNITPQTQLLRRLVGVLTKEELTAVERYYACQVQLEQFSSNLSTLVRDAELQTSTSQKQASSSSAGPSASDVATSPSGSSSSYDMRPFLEADGYPDSPASSPAPAQGGSEGCKYQWWHKGEYYTCNYPVVQDDRCRLHLGKEAAPYSTVTRPALTNHEGRE